MKIFKTLFATALITVLSFGCLSAQGISEAIELYNSGLKAFHASEYAQAIVDIEKALKIAANEEDEQAAELRINAEKLLPRLYFDYGRQQINNKMHTEGLATLNKAKEIAEKLGDDTVMASLHELMPQVYTIIGQADTEAGRHTEGIANFRKALEFDKTNSTIYLRLGLAQEQAKDEEGAIATFNHIVTMEGAKPADVANANRRLGTIFLRRAAAGQQTRNWTSVFDNAKKSVEHDNANMQAQRLLGAAALELKRWDDAINAFEAVLASNPAATDKNTTIYRLAMAYEGKGNRAKACANYRLIVSDPQFKAFAESKVRALCQ